MPPFYRHGTTDVILAWALVLVTMKLKSCPGTGGRS